MAVERDAETEIFIRKVVVVEGRYEALTARRTQRRRLAKQVALLAALIALVLGFWYVGLIPAPALAPLEAVKYDPRDRVGLR